MKKKRRYGVNNPFEANLIVPFWQEVTYLSMLSSCNARAACAMMLPSCRNFHVSVFPGGDQLLWHATSPRSQLDCPILARRDLSIHAFVFQCPCCLCYGASKLQTKICAHVRSLCAWLPVCHLQSSSEYRWPWWMACEESCMRAASYLSVYRYDGSLIKTRSIQFMMR